MNTTLLGVEIPNTWKLIKAIQEVNSRIGNLESINVTNINSLGANDLIINATSGTGNIVMQLG